MTRSKLYLLTIIGCIAGYIWLYIPSLFPGCLFKKVTSLPCPSCGSSLSVKYLLQGNLENAWDSNPLGFFILGILIVAPLWITIDFIFHRSSFLSFYLQAEKLFKQKRFWIPFLFIILLNWIKNICKSSLF